MDRVKFYSINDMANGIYLQHAEEKIKQYEAGKEPQDINELIEIYNIKEYFNNKVYHLNWSNDDIARYLAIIKNAYAKVAIFFSSISDDNLITTLNNVDVYNYYDDFWKLMETFKVHKEISTPKFNEVMLLPNFTLYKILIHKKLVNHFGQAIREYMLANNESAELLLSEFEIQHDGRYETYYFPGELTDSDKEKIINNYIESEHPNLNYLQLIASIQSNPDRIAISAKTILKAKRKADLEGDKFFAKNAGILMETFVAFSKSQTEEIIFKRKGYAIEAKYSSKWIEENSDFATLLNNFIYLFEFVDLQMRSNHVNKLNQMGVFERMIFTRSRNAYVKGTTFDRMNILSLLQMTGYYNELTRLDIRLEDVIEWFFKEYLKTEFGANHFKLSMPSENATYLEKCNSTMPALEFVLKQFFLFIDDGVIDFDLLSVKSDQLVYENIPSLIRRKYVYGFGNEFHRASFLLFSDQSRLRYHKQAKKTYDNFFAFLENEKFKLIEFENYQQKDINWLLENQYLAIKDDNVEFNNLIEIIILRDLYFNEVVSYWKYSEQGRNLIDALEIRGVVEIKSSLFSKSESDYINYLLNKAKFNNGLDLRNIYSHLQPYSNEEQKIHEQNYMIFLRLFVLTVIKINDDFCIAKDNDM